MIRIFLTDDHPLILNGLKNLLSHTEGIEVEGTYRNGEELLQALKSCDNTPDIILLDIQMPGLQGDIICKQITRSYPNIKVIALTNLDNVYQVKSMFKAGASGYVLKTSSEEVIIKAIHKVNNNEQFLEKSIQEAMLQYSLGSGTSPKGPLLTEREKEVLQLITENNTSKEIAEKLFVSKRTIDHHRNNLLLKLDVKNTAALIKKAISMGLME